MLRYLRAGDEKIRLNRTLVMGILNVTPDSFSDGGRWLDVDRAVAHGLEMRAQGADIIDVGGESTRPGALSVGAPEEMRRVLPVIERLGGLISIDTSKAAVAQAALRAGARIVNDVTALGDPRMGRVVSRSGAALILMHRKGSPRTMQKDPTYGDVVGEVMDFLRRRLKRALSAGISRDRILVDPGIGFGKRPEHNLEILRRLSEFRRLGCPVAVGTSRKSFIGHVLGRDVRERLPGTAATVTAAVLRGADLVRVHDVEEMTDVVRMSDALK
jgi:dihydropteroate synthase